ncbi:hypothetical protein CDR68_25020 [Salmonella enterica]|nr:hypothetical protein [Salmonella enterica]
MGYLTAWQIADHAPLTFEHDLRGMETARRSEAGFYQTLAYTRTGMPETTRPGRMSGTKAWSASGCMTKPTI